MTGTKNRSSRRAFFLSSGAVLGAGVATAVGASAAVPESAMSVEEQLKQLREQLANLDDREAIRGLYLAFAGFIEQQRYEAAAELFDEHADLDLSGVSAGGKSEIAKLFEHQYRGQNASVLHSAYRRSASQQQDSVTLSQDRQRASGTFHTEVDLCTPLQSDCTAATMARLQGNVADHRWEAGRFEAEFVKAEGQWKVASLRYQVA
jgi:hypothetical protein